MQNQIVYKEMRRDAKQKAVRREKAKTGFSTKLKYKVHQLQILPKFFQD